MKKVLILLISIICICHAAKDSIGANPAKTYSANNNVDYKIIGKYHRADNQLFFTEGLSFDDQNTLLESTGLYGDSEIHFIKNFDSDKPELSGRHSLERKYFGEGSDKIQTADGQYEHYMMTYKERTVFVFDSTLKNILRQYDMPQVIAEGWGMTHFTDNDGKVKILVSDGTNKLFHINPEGFVVEKEVAIYDKNGQGVDQINELETYKDGTVLANIWNTNKVAKINISDGQLIDMYSFQGLIDDLESEPKLKNYVDPWYGNVLNGIAYHKDSQRLILGGKRWPYFYEIELNDK